VLRELTFLSEEQQQDWAEQMKDLLLSMKEDSAHYVSILDSDPGTCEASFQHGVASAG
jgi:hypothetical protein